MSQRHVVIIIMLLLLGGLLAAGISQFQSDTQVKLTPTPTPSEIQINVVGSVSPAPNQTGSGSKTKMIKQYPNFPGVLNPEKLKNKKAVLETSKGVIEFEIYPEATKAASNFIFLTQDGFYDGLLFHRVEPGFVIQGGDPLGNGTGGPGYQFEDEPVTQPYNKGIVAMANAGPNTNGSQFFIMLADTPSLPARYTIFGKVISGQSVVDSIQVGDKMIKVEIKNR